MPREMVSPNLPLGGSTLRTQHKDPGAVRKMMQPAAPAAPAIYYPGQAPSVRSVGNEKTRPAPPVYRPPATSAGLQRQALPPAIVQAKPLESRPAPRVYCPQPTSQEILMHRVDVRNGSQKTARLGVSATIRQSLVQPKARAADRGRAKTGPEMLPGPLSGDKAVARSKAGMTTQIYPVLQQKKCYAVNTQSDHRSPAKLKVAAPQAGLLPCAQQQMKTSVRDSGGNGSGAVGPHISSKQAATHFHSSANAVQTMGTPALASMSPSSTEPNRSQKTRVSGVHGKVVQRTKYDTDVRIIDTADHDDFINFAEAMSRVNPQRLESLRHKILEKAITTQNTDDLWATRFLNKLLGNLPEWPGYPPIDHSRIDANLPAEPYVRCGNTYKSAAASMVKTKRFVKLRCSVGPWPDVTCWWPISDIKIFRPNKLGFIPQCEYGESGGGNLNSRAKAMHPEDAEAYPQYYS